MGSLMLLLSGSCYSHRPSCHQSNVFSFLISSLENSFYSSMTVQVHERENTGEVDVLTKGDSSGVDDIGLYADGQVWLHRHHVMGRAVGFLPYVGCVTIIMTEKPIIKYILIGALCLLVIRSKH